MRYFARIIKSSAPLALCLYSTMAVGFGLPWFSGSDEAPLDFKLPLSTQGPAVVGSCGTKIHLNCINWTGADFKNYVLSGLGNQTLDTIAQVIKDGGFNCIRYPWSLEVMKFDPILEDSVVAYEPALKGQRAMFALHYTVTRLTKKHGLLVIMDNHVSDAVWCCFSNDLNGLWFTDNFSEQDWIESWKSMATLFKDNNRVIGFELRNELRTGTVAGKVLDPKWITNDEKVDFSRAAKKVSEVIHGVNPDALIFVETAHFSSHLNDAAKKPLVLSHPNKVVYTIHEYIWFHNNIDFKRAFALYQQDPNHPELAKDRAKLIQDMDQKYGTFSQTYPVWLSEIGRDFEVADVVSSPMDLYWDWFIQYYRERDFVGFAFWRLDNFYAYTPRTKYGSFEPYALINKSWTGFTNLNLLNSLRSICKRNVKPTEQNFNF